MGDATACSQVEGDSVWGGWGGLRGGERVSFTWVLFMTYTPPLPKNKKKHSA